MGIELTILLAAVVLSILFSKESYTNTTGYIQDSRYFPYNPHGHGYMTYQKRSFKPFGYGYRPYYGYKMYQNSHRTTYPGYERPMYLKSEVPGKQNLYGDY